MFPLLLEKHEAWILSTTCMEYTMLTSADVGSPNIASVFLQVTQLQGYLRLLAIFTTTAPATASTALAVATITGFLPQKSEAAVKTLPTQSASTSIPCSSSRSIDIPKSPSTSPGLGGLGGAGSISGTRLASA